MLFVNIQDKHICQTNSTLNLAGFSYPVYTSQRISHTVPMSIAKTKFIYIYILAMWIDPQVQKFQADWAEF